MNTAQWSELRTDLALAFRTRPTEGNAQRLLVLLHGVGGNETNLAALAASIPNDTRIVLARGPLTLGPGQHAWFRVAFGPHGPTPDLDAAEASRVQLIAFVSQLQAAFSVPAPKTVVAGFSQGGIMSASIGLTRPDALAGFGILAGRILPELAPQIAERPSLAGVHAFIGHGRDDTKLPVDWAYKADAWLKELGVEHDTRLYPGDHGIPVAMQTDFEHWFDQVTSESRTAPRR
jgi:phospholipase/carboxylesterase